AGIAPDFLPYVFQPFRQAESTTTRRHPGLGLGLAIVRHLVELHGGKVATSSPGKGRGATFSVVLPGVSATTSVREEGAETTHAVSGMHSAHTAALTGVRVLVVDDEPDARDLLVTMLTQTGAAVR